MAFSYPCIVNVMEFLKSKQKYLKKGRSFALFRIYHHSNLQTSEVHQNWFHRFLRTRSVTMKLIMLAALLMVSTAAISKERTGVHSPSNVPMHTAVREYNRIRCNFDPSKNRCLRFVCDKRFPNCKRLRRSKCCNRGRNNRRQRCCVFRRRLIISCKGFCASSTPMGFNAWVVFQ